MSDGFVTKQIKLIREVVPSTELIAVLVNPSNPNSAEETTEAREAQALLGIKTTGQPNYRSSSPRKSSSPSTSKPLKRWA